MYYLLNIEKHNNGDYMKVILGYVSIPLTLNITSSKTITYTRFKEIDNGLDKINNIIIENLDSLLEIQKYNIKNNIHFYRLTSNLIPLATTEIEFDYIDKYKDKYREIGRIINKNNIRVDMHPGEYCVLNSTKKEVIENSFQILKYHYNIIDVLNIKNPKLVLHVGSSEFGKKNSLIRFINNYNKLDSKIQKMIIIENDDKVFNVKDVLSLCNVLDIPMVLDYHHYICNNEGDDIEDYLLDIFSTWKRTNLSPKVHFSSPKKKKKKDFRSHNDYINVDSFISFVEMCKKYTDELYIMIEAKMKDIALFNLVRELKYKTNYKFIDDTSFIVK